MKSPTLHTRIQTQFWLPVLVLAASSWIAAPAFAAVGQMIFVAGDVKVKNLAGQTRAATRGGSIDEGETIQTAPGASAQLRMVDNGFIAVRSDTELKFDKYQYRGREDGSENALMSLVKGGFRTITGIIGRSNKTNYLVTTPSATIGIRGTDHEPFFIPPPAPGQIPIGTPGAYNKVNTGSTTMTTAVGSQIIGGQSSRLCGKPQHRAADITGGAEFHEADRNPSGASQTRCGEARAGETRRWKTCGREACCGKARRGCASSAG